MEREGLSQEAITIQRRFEIITYSVQAVNCAHSHSSLLMYHHCHLWGVNGIAYCTILMTKSKDNVMA